MIQSLNQYLVKSKADIDQKFIDLLVMGNEAADLDSMASALAFAYIRATAQTDKTIVPLMPIIREDFKLRTEAVYVFEQARIDPANMIFLDDFMPLGMDRVKDLAIVDHNKLSPVFEPHGDKIRTILDHHKEERLYPHAEIRIIEPVGSTATLVGDIMIQDFPQLLDGTLAMLLTGTILLDTVNLDLEAGRVTAKDSEITLKLMKICTIDQDSYFRAVQKAKFDTADLTTFDLLRKDYKEFRFGGIRCGIASALLPVEDWGKKDKELCSGFETYAQCENLDVLLSMNAYTDSKFNRDLAVYCTDSISHDKLVTFLQEKDLELKSLSMDSQAGSLEGKLSFYAQKNLGISRKKLSPMLDEYFTS